MSTYSGDGNTIAFSRLLRTPEQRREAIQGEAIATLGEQVRLWRCASGVTLAELAKILQLSEHDLSELERGLKSASETGGRLCGLLNIFSSPAWVATPRVQAWREQGIARLSKVFEEVHPSDAKAISEVVDPKITVYVEAVLTRLREMGPPLEREASIPSPDTSLTDFGEVEGETSWVTLSPSAAVPSDGVVKTRPQGVKRTRGRHRTL